MAATLVRSINIQEGSNYDSIFVFLAFTYHLSSMNQKDSNLH